MSLDKLTVPELKALAEKEEVEIASDAKKADIIAALNEAGIESPDDALDIPDDTPSKPAAAEKEEESEEEPEEHEYRVKPKAELDDETKQALAARDAKQRQNPAFRRQEWFRYKKLGGKSAPWRRPRGIHSKMRRHYKYRPPVVRIGFRTPAEARGLHPSGFEEVLVYRPDDLADLDPKSQAARVGGTVGGRKQAAIVAKADELGIRVLNRGGN